jgi:hypothetical protein
MYVKWTDHTARLTASVVKEVTCEKCGEQFVYALQRTETGTGTSFYGLDEEGASDRAARRAVEHLQEAIANAFELVPCPSCGTYQAQMVQFMKNAHLKWMQVLGLALIGLAIVLFAFGAFSAHGPWIVTAAALLLIGVGLMAYRRWQADLYDPNQGDAEPRKRLAEGIAVLKKDLPKAIS